VQRESDDEEQEVLEQPAPEPNAPSNPLKVCVLCALCCVCCSSTMTQSNRFDELDINDRIKSKLRDVFKFTTMTEIQEKCIPPLLAGKNVLGVSAIATKTEWNKQNNSKV
jgi:polyferredoxin